MGLLNRTIEASTVGYPVLSITQVMASQKKFFDLTNSDDIFELNRIVFDSESEDEGSQNDSDEDDVIIPDFKDDHPDEDEKSENEDEDPDEDEQSENEDDSQSEDPLPPASDSEDDEPLAQIQLADRDKVKVLKVPTKLRGIEAWHLCITRENLDKITEYTNKEITIQRLNYAKNMNNSDTEDTSRPSYTKDINNAEIQALFGLFYYAGVMKMSGVFTKELFDKDSGIPIFRATMPEARFRFLEGVDTLDQLCHTYSTGRKTRRWPLCLFYNLLNIVGYNSLVLLRGSDAPDKEIITSRRAYLKKLALDLVKPHMEGRLEIPTLRRELRQTICNVLKITPAEEVPIRPHTTTGRCTFCLRSKDRKSRVNCAVCKKFICLEHQKKICPTCAE
ncbi:hypothetical protein NQ314_020239 [Rhamnusium bicolor]|uniref:PiggyBac transposable element-derived protein domain-containing protein n=1 Tax=Rhamnusium bicolor TaxID=1586634 RepID=A0AAV8WKN4_9CUCU|nr:hypothetical protein NQ314_020239 [Rhamnusium bicolor]